MNEIEYARAINAAHYSCDRKHPRTGRWPRMFSHFVYTRGYKDIAVTRVALKTPYVIPSVRPKYAHVPRFAWIAWRKGEPVKMQVRFLCGGYSWTARGEVTTEFPVCVRCRLVLAGTEPVARCLDRVERAA